MIGCDDTNIAKILVPSLTTIAIDKNSQGERIAEQLIGEISGKRQKVKEVFQAYAVYRESLSEYRG